MGIIQYLSYPGLFSNPVQSHSIFKPSKMFCRTSKYLKSYILYYEFASLLVFVERVSLSHPSNSKDICDEKLKGLPRFPEGHSNSLLYGIFLSILAGFQSFCTHIWFKPLLWPSYKNKENLCKHGRYSHYRSLVLICGGLLAWAIRSVTNKEGLINTFLNLFPSCNGEIAKGKTKHNSCHLTGELVLAYQTWLSNFLRTWQFRFLHSYISLNLRECLHFNANGQQSWNK